MGNGVVTTKELSNVGRLTWFDSVKGLSILWIAIFHFFLAYDQSRHPWLLSPSSLFAFVEGCARENGLQTIGCFLDGLLTIVFERGSQAVGVFIVLSGFGLAYGLTKKGGISKGWSGWYRRRVLRLFPMYWMAHLVCLVSPFVHLENPVDYRFILSFFGNRCYPAETMFYYLVPAWWFFGLLIQLYLLFPVLYTLLRKIGPIFYLLVCMALTVFARYLIQDVFKLSYNYLQGAFFAGRLWEFATGMVIGFYYAQRSEVVEKRLFSPLTLVMGIFIYLLGAYSYQPYLTYVFTDGLVGTGLFIVLVHVVRWTERVYPLSRILCLVGTYSYGLYLLHQPYTTYFGEKLHNVGMIEFVFYSWVIVAGIALVSVALEHHINSLTDRLAAWQKTDRSATSAQT